MKEKVIVGLSGGVDSSVAAYLLKEKGYEVLGVTMQVFDGPDGEIMSPAIADAKKVADYLGIPHMVVDFREDFHKHVIEYFVNEYLQGRTPNPCNVCNRYVKWEALMNKGNEMGASFIATGHYARIDKLKNGRYAIRNSLTAKKDQTYALYDLTQDQLSHTLMPVGEYEKEKIREIAYNAGIPVADKKDSQDICFIQDGDYVGFIRRELERATAGSGLYGKQIPQKGNYVNQSGDVIGIHEGIMNYTIGQRKGLNLAMGHPVFVTRIKPETNEVVIGENEDLFTTEFYCKNPNFMAIEDLKEPMYVNAKVRYSHKGDRCLIEKVENNLLKCTFDTPVRAITSGQAAVFYDGEYVLGGGIIL